MSRYTGPAYKKSRRLGFSTLENGKDLAKRPYKPGQHGQDRKSKPSNYSIQLNEKQKEAVLYNDGPLLIIAGAGAGKTKTLTTKIAYLIQEEGKEVSLGNGYSYIELIRFS